MVTHSSFLAWRIPWIEEPGRLQSLSKINFFLLFFLKLSTVFSACRSEKYKTVSSSTVSIPIMAFIVCRYFLG